MEFAMARRILWLDNDPSQLIGYVDVLKRAGFHTELDTSPLSVEAKLRREHFDLLILDVMIPTASEAEEKVFSPDLTEAGASTGLFFYRRNRPILEEQGT